MSLQRKRVVVAGASGFVGRALIPLLTENYDVIALSRKERPAEASVEWRACDLFSLLETERALEGADIGIFLVHSMLPSSRLTQGNFEDLDAIVADNFARAAEKAGLSQLVYLGGLIDDKRKKLSRHLESRLEVERILEARQVPLTGLRAGLIVGPGGSSFLMLLRLVQRLPIMVLPRWTRTKTQPVDLRNVLEGILGCLGRQDFYGRVFDLGGPDILSYEEVIRRTAQVLKKRPFLLRVPFFSPGFSKLWVSLVTGAPISLVGPLVDSLLHRMTVSETNLLKELEISSFNFEESLTHTLGVVKSAPNRLQEMKASRSKVRSESKVRSVQRLPLPRGMRAIDVMDEYIRWLPSLFKALIRADTKDKGECEFRIAGLNWVLLRLVVDFDRSTADRPLLRIRGGLLARAFDKGRLEFREILDRQVVLAAIHDYSPRLPWFIYNLTQAKAHLWVMNKFRNHLSLLQTSRKKKLEQRRSP